MNQKEKLAEAAELVAGVYKDLSNFQQDGANRLKLAGVLLNQIINADKGSLPLVIIESPYAGDIEANVAFARACVSDSLHRGEAPIASHLLYTQPGILIDEIPEERQWGIDAGLAWRRVADKTVVYVDRGISKGMEYGIAAAKNAGLEIEYRTLTGIVDKSNVHLLFEESKK